MNAPLHFKQQLADELTAHATSLSAPAGHRTVVRLRSPRRRTALALGAVAATVAAVAVAVPLATGSGTTQDTAGTRATAGTVAAPTPHGTAGTRLDIVNADYAVKSDADGGVAIALYTPKGVPGLQAALRTAGIPATVMEVSASCHTPVHSADRSAENVAKVMPPALAHRGPGGTITHLIKPGAIPEGEHLLFEVRSEPGLQALLPTLVDRVPGCVPSE